MTYHSCDEDVTKIRLLAVEAPHVHIPNTLGLEVHVAFLDG